MARSFCTAVMLRLPLVPFDGGGGGGGDVLSPILFPSSSSFVQFIL